MQIDAVAIVGFALLALAALLLVVRCRVHKSRRLGSGTVIALSLNIRGAHAPGRRLRLLRFLVGLILIRRPQAGRDAELLLLRRELSVLRRSVKTDGEPVPEEHEPPRLVTVTVAA